jgi:diguanylate cyclase (GGDEF)-like protein
MRHWRNRGRGVFAVIVCCALLQPVRADAPTSSIAELLVQTEQVRTTDHQRFLRQLETLNQQVSSMSEQERWQLRYLDGWQASFQGDYVNADPLLQDVIDHSGDSVLVTKATAILMDDMGSNKRYGEAFELANRLEADLPKTQDKLARSQALYFLAQLLRSAGQYDLAADYARDMEQSVPAGETLCRPQAMLATILYESHKLTSSSPEVQQGIDTCQDAGDLVIADAVWLVKDNLYLDENQPEKAIALLNLIAPSIRAGQYHGNTLTAQSQLAQAYWKIGNDDKARAAALAVLAASEPGDINGSLRDAYEVLYRIEKKHGNTKAALNYYEHYAVQNLGHLNDESARTLAYDVAHQRTLAQRIETEKLGKQNNILRLQQALANKAIETSRLYIALLLVVLISVIFWLLRIKRSQLRFQQQACLDGLTGVFNHQHFISEAQQALEQLERKHGTACLMFIDLDHFKQINDAHGHAVGDAVLKHTVAVCKQPLRASDLFGRLGGEEFGILLLSCSHEQGMEIANRIRATLEATPFVIDGGLITFSASIGLASTQTSGYGLQRLCREADAALYRAKRFGRNRVISDAERGNPAAARHAGT